MPSDQFVTNSSHRLDLDASDVPALARVAVFEPICIFHPFSLSFPLMTQQVVPNSYICYDMFLKPNVGWNSIRVYVRNVPWSDVRLC